MKLHAVHMIKVSTAIIDITFAFTKNLKTYITSPMRERLNLSYLISHELFLPSPRVNCHFQLYFSYGISVNIYVKIERRRSKLSNKLNYKLTDLADVIRSKNSGPYELTFDIIFKDFDVYKKVADAKVFNSSMFAKLYGIDSNKVMEVINFDPAKAIKITIERPICSGNLGETDVYGAQQHAPLMDLEFEME